MLFTGGTACNVVPEYAKASYAGKIYEAFGAAAHAFTPEAGENAILKLAAELQGIIQHPVMEFLIISTIFLYGSCTYDSVRFASANW
ncbi:MAG: hypothetical protein LLG02_02395 [Pelosinus sp.]|nr:hypothetical protein [Pelosinus sp.]